MKQAAVFGSIPPPHKLVERIMHRPTRQHRNLLAKIENKTARSRNRGKKAKRWSKWAAEYKALITEGANTASE